MTLADFDALPWYAQAGLIIAGLAFAGFLRWGAGRVLGGEFWKPRRRK